MNTNINTQTHTLECMCGKVNATWKRIGWNGMEWNKMKWNTLCCCLLLFYTLWLLNAEYHLDERKRRRQTKHIDMRTRAYPQKYSTCFPSESSEPGKSRRFFLKYLWTEFFFSLYVNIPFWVNFCAGFCHENQRKPEFTRTSWIWNVILYADMHIKSICYCCCQATRKITSKT